MLTLNLSGTLLLWTCMASWQRQTQFGLFEAHTKCAKLEWGMAKQGKLCKHLLIVQFWEFSSRIMELCRIINILSLFAFLFHANNHSTITPYSPTKQVSWQLTCGLNLVPHITFQVTVRTSTPDLTFHWSKIWEHSLYLLLTWQRNYYFNLGILLICNKKSVWPKYNHSETY